jgi:hypothetical protein
MIAIVYSPCVAGLWVGSGCKRTLSQELNRLQNLAALFGIGDVQLVQVTFPQAPEIIDALEAMHGQQRPQLLKQTDTTILLK